MTRGRAGDIPSERENGIVLKRAVASDRSMEVLLGANRNGSGWRMASRTRREPATVSFSSVLRGSSCGRW
jgi:hypothetical protein